MLSRLDKKTQLPLPNPEEVAKNEAAQKIANLKRKRLTLSLLLAGSIGLSLIFWSYRYFKTNPISLALPQVKNTQTTGDIVLNSELKQFLNQNQHIKSLHLKVTNPDSEFSYGQKPLQIPSLDQINNRLTTSADFPLPEGLVYKQLDNEQEIVISIATPGRNFLFYLQSDNIGDVKSRISQIIPLAYWSVFGN